MPTKATAVPTPLAHLIPSLEFYDDYISRRIGGVKDTDLLKYALTAKKNILISGPTGPGKTSLILAYGAKYKRPVVTIQCNGAVDPNSFWGNIAFNEDGSIAGYQYSEVTEVIMNGGVVYMDEANFLPPKISAVWHGALDKRRQITIPELGNKVIHVNENTQFIAAYNPNYEGTKPLNEAFKNRFPIKVFMDYDAAVEAELLSLPVMLEIAGKLREAQKMGELDTPISTNMLMEFEELCIDLGYEFALVNFLNAFATEERQSVAETFDVHSAEVQAQVKEMEKLNKELQEADA